VGCRPAGATRRSTASARQTCGNHSVDGGGVVEYGDGNLGTKTAASRQEEEEDARGCSQSDA
jgi:hypothetical protein